jgi:hypothetical protein
MHEETKYTSFIPQPSFTQIYGYCFSSWVHTPRCEYIAGILLDLATQCIY